MHYRTLGQTGLQVSEVGRGAMPFGGMVTRPDGTQFGWSGTDDRELIALVHRSEALGVTLLDTAAAYGNGHGEAVVGEALQGRRDRWIVATKVNPNQGIDADTPDEAAVRKRITEACEQSLHRLRTGLHRCLPTARHSLPLGHAERYGDTGGIARGRQDPVVRHRHQQPPSD